MLAAFFDSLISRHWVQDVMRIMQRRFCLREDSLTAVFSSLLNARRATSSKTGLLGLRGVVLETNTMLAAFFDSLISRRWARCNENLVLHFHYLKIFTKKVNK